MARKKTRESVEQQARFLTVGELAERWRISKALAYRFADTLGCLRVNAAIRIPLIAVERYELSQLGPRPPEAA